MYRAIRVQEALRNLRGNLNRGWISAVEQAAGHSPGYLTKVFNGKRKPDVETLLALLDRPEVDAEEFLGEVGIKIEFSPQSYLARIPKQGRRDPLLQELEEAASRVSTDSKPDTGILTDLSDLDGVRFSDAETANEKLHELVTACAGSPSPETVGRALSSYAEDRRLRADHGLAARALTRALNLQSGPWRELPVILQRTSYLLSNHNWLRAAARCAKEACDLCVQLDDRPGIGKMLYTRAVMARRQEDTAGAMNFCRSALAYLARSDWVYRFCTYHTLALCHKDLGQYDVAMRELAKAASTHQTRRGISWLKVPWLQGVIALRLGKTHEAEQYLRQTYDGFQQGPDPVTTALVSLDLCKALLEANKPLEIINVAEKMIALLTPLRDNPVASAAILRFLDTARMGNATLHGIESTIERIKRGRRLQESSAP